MIKEKGFTIKHFLYPRSKKDIKSEAETHSVYVRLVIRRENTKFPSLMIHDFFNEEKFNLQIENKNSKLSKTIEQEEKLIIFFIDLLGLRLHPAVKLSGFIRNLKEFFSSEIFYVLENYMNEVLRLKVIGYSRGLYNLIDWERGYSSLISHLEGYNIIAANKDLELLIHETKKIDDSLSASLFKDHFSDSHDSSEDQKLEDETIYSILSEPGKILSNKERTCEMLGSILEKKLDALTEPSFLMSDPSSQIKFREQVRQKVKRILCG